MKVDVLLGLQWGDEGKGKAVDVLTPNYDVITRFQGGPNAGHSLEFNNMKHVLHTIPSGVFHQNKINIIGNGVVVDPVTFAEEFNGLLKLGIDLRKNLYLSKKTHLILPSHRALDAGKEAAKGKEKIGSTLKGIGPAYTDKTARTGLRIGDITSPKFNEKYNKAKDQHKKLLEIYPSDFNLDEYEQEWMKSIELLKEFTHIDSEHVINNYVNEGKKMLAEGAQGTLLDIDFGTYPFVTSSNTVCAGACTGMGIAPQKIGDVYGIFKAYITRVGSGPFPTELNDQTGEEIRKIGREFGATTGRPRRCGWMDLVALKYVVMLNGVTKLIMTKADVLDAFDTIKIATGYKINGEVVDYMPYDIDVDLEPLYKEFKGWKKDITKMRNADELPAELLEYIKFIEDQVGVPVSIVSVGPERDATIFR